MTSVPAFVTAVIALMLVPGPDMSYSIASGMAYGRRGAFYASLGIGLGGLILTVATAILLFTVHGIDPRSILAVQALGSLYLFYLSIRIIVPRQVPFLLAEATRIPLGQIVSRGIVTNITNPKALIFFLSFIPQFIPPDYASPEYHAVFLGVLLCIIGTVINFMFGILGTVARPLSDRMIGGRSVSQYILAGVFFIVALSFLWHIADAIDV